MLARFFPFPVAFVGLATLVRTGLCALVFCAAPTLALDAYADTGDGGADTGDAGDSGDAGSTFVPSDTGSGGDTSDTGSGSVDNGFQGDGPAELAGEQGGGCPMVSQSAAFLGVFLTLGVAGRRRTLRRV